jgi:6-phosphofructokinase 1
MIICGENADRVYDTAFITALLQKEGGELFDARPAVLGHIQEGGDPSPFDRIEATRLTAHCIDYLAEQLESGAKASAMVGMRSGRLQFTDLTSYPALVEPGSQRPREQRWLDDRHLVQLMSG